MLRAMGSLWARLLSAALLGLATEPLAAEPGIPGEQENYVFNGSFEAGLWGWTMWDGDNGWHGRYYFSAATGPSEYVHGGTSAIVISCGKPGQGGIFQRLRTPLDKGTYCLRFHIRGHPSQGVHTGVAVQVVWSFANKDGDITQPGRGERIPVENKWTLKEFPIEVTSDVVTNVTLCLMSWGGGNLVIDDVSLVSTDGRKRPVPTPTKTPKRTRRPAKPPRVQIRDESVWLNGEPWLPIGIYGVDDPDVLANSGFNVVCPYLEPGSQPGIPMAGTPRMGEFLDKCTQRGLWVTIDVGSVVALNAPEAGMRAELKNALDGIKGHPAIAAWHMADEPDWRYGVSKDSMRNAVTIMKELDHLPTWTCLSRQSGLDTFADVLDILGRDVYPGNNVGPILESTEACRKAGRGRPVWMVLQAGGIDPPMMTAHAYAALIHGASGLLYFDYSSARSTPENWAALTQLTLELKQLTTILAARPPEPAEVKADRAPIHSLVRRQDRELWLLTLNTGGEPQKAVRVQAPGLGAKRRAVEVLFEGRHVDAQEGALTDDFAPFARHVYRWKQK